MCVYICQCMYMCAYMDKSVHEVCVWFLFLACTRACPLSHTRTYTRTHTRTHTNIYAHTHAYMYPYPYHIVYIYIVLYAYNLSCSSSSCAFCLLRWRSMLSICDHVHITHNNLVISSSISEITVCVYATLNGHVKKMRQVDDTLVSFCFLSFLVTQVIDQWFELKP